MAASEHRPVLIVIAGPKGSGKTSVISIDNGLSIFRLQSN